MKTALLFFLCLLTPVFAVVETATNPLVGNWRHVDGTQTCNYFFSDDGTFTGNFTRNGKIVWEFAGKWSSDGKALDYEYTRSSAQHVPPGTKDRDKLVEVTKDFYIIEAQNGSRRKYTRMAPAAK